MNVYAEPLTLLTVMFFTITTRFLSEKPGVTLVPVLYTPFVTNTVSPSTAASTAA